ncbi:MAG: hypothetical protein E7563_03860 [Ruminococcaceae bacterium]|nr:hypothetical protein [Oscillospiraceae bacterium]
MAQKKLKAKQSNKNIFSAFFGWINNTETMGKFIPVYSVCFCLLALLIYFPFIIRNNSLIWETDGLSQHYPVLVYYGKWLREILHNIFIEHSFTIPTWDINIGLGSDIITTFNYYGFGDPLCAVSVFVPEAYTMYLYNALIIIRLYLAGLFFSLFCFRMKQKGVEVMLGAFAYIFCGFSIFASVRHPFFTVPVMLLPLLLYGAEKILSKESPVLFTVAVFLSFLINFYFSYMLILITVVYVLVRFFTGKEKKKIKDFFSSLFRFITSGIIGVMMAAIILLPVLIVFMNSSRSDIVRETPILYDAAYYVGLYAGFSGYSVPGFWTYTGFIPVTIISALLLFKQKGEHRSLKILFGISAVILLIPYLGKVMNGFTYVANRWIWAFAMLVSYIFVAMFKHLVKLTVKEKKYLFIAGSVYILSCAVMLNLRNNVSATAQIIILAFILILLLSAKELFGENSKKIITNTLSVLCVVSLCINSFFCYSATNEDYASQFIDMKDVNKIITDCISNKMANRMSSEEFSRYEQTPNKKIRNQSVLNGTHGVAFYWSLTDSYVAEFLRETQGVTYVAHDYVNMNRNTAVDELFAVKYFFTKSKTQPVPYGYEYEQSIKTAEGEFHVYVNQNPLPLGFGYSEYITRDEYDNLTAAEKQEVLLSHILLENNIEEYSNSNYTLTSKKLNSIIECDENISIEGNCITVKENKAKLTFKFNDVKDCELYLDVKGMYAEDELWSSDIMKLNGEWKKMSMSEKYPVLRKELMSRDVKYYMVSAKSGNCTYNFNVATPTYQAYDGNHNFLANTGYSENSRNALTLTFSDAGVYSFESMDVIMQPMDNYDTNVRNRSKNVLENVKLIDNGFTGTTELSEPQLMFFSVPYSDGFEAFVDGEKAEILRANTWGMALDLEEGEHTIEFRYHTRGLKAGAYISLAGVIAFAGMIVLDSRKKNKSNK